MGSAELTEHAGLLGVAVTNGGLLVPVVVQSKAQKTGSVYATQARRLDMAIGRPAVEVFDQHIQAVELELVVLGRLDGAVLRERADDVDGLVELGFDRHDEDDNRR